MDMHVVVATEARFHRNEQGTITSDTGGRGYAFWRRYLDVFDEVTVLARLAPGTAKGPGAPVEGPGVRVHALPDYSSSMTFAWNASGILRRIRAAQPRDAALIARVPGALGSLLLARPRREGRPYGLEVVGDPHEALAPGALHDPARPLARLWSTRRLRALCREAAAVAYVTEHALQRRYPPGRSAFTTSYSSVELPAEAFATAPRGGFGTNGPFRLLTVGSLAHLHKAPDVLIESVARCTAKGLDLHLEFVGDGKHRPALEALVRRKGLGERVRFRGVVHAGAGVRRRLDAADLFVLPSRTEGLPRAVIEAMARALPCIGSEAGGIPELLQPEDLVPPGNSAALAGKIEEVLSSPERLRRMSERNLRAARRFHDPVLRERRVAFLSQLEEATARWRGRLQPAPSPVGVGS